MVETTPNRRLRAGGVGRVLAGALALAVLAGTGAIAAATDSRAAMLVLQALALAGGAIAWYQARSARAAADRIAVNLDAVATRLLQVEFRLLHQQAGTGTDPALHSTVAEVTGEIGLLGGLVRDLAETVAAQDRDVADLKERLSPPEPSHPEPSLLPSARREPSARPAGEAKAADDPESGLADADARRLAAAIRSGDAPLSDADARRMAAIVDAFEVDRIEVHLQPVVALPTRKIRFYEVLARLRLADGTLLAPAEFLPLVDRLGHAAELDRRVAGRAIAIARHLMARGSEAIVSVNVSSRAIEEAGFLRSLIRIVDAFPDTVGRIVFELSQRCWRTLDAERAGVLAALRDRGVPFALDRATDLRLDPLALADRGVRFVKVPADLLLADPNPDLDIESRDLAAGLRRAGIELVADRVEREETVPDLLNLDVPLAQGFVFAAPRAVRSEVLALPAENDTPAAAEPPLPPSPPGHSSAGGGHLPYRTVPSRAG